MPATENLIRFLACGSVDDGKSTLIGHLVHLTGNLYDDQLQVLEQESTRIGTVAEGLDYSLLMDGLIAEREQGITIDVAYRYFATPTCKFIVADTPGHESYTRNMATGASQCSAALILVDARQGVLSQTRRHGLICALLGIRQLLFAVNKMDAAGWDEQLFRGIEAECERLVTDLGQFGVTLSQYAVVPVSALQGDNLVAPSARMPWYRGTTILDWLQGTVAEPARGFAEFRLPVQYVIKAARSEDGWQHGAEDEMRRGTGTFRAYAGTIVSGTVRRGDRLVSLPAGLKTTVEGVWNGDTRLEQASAGMAVAVTLAGEHDVVRGDCLAMEAAPPEMSHVFKARLVWMAEQMLYAGRQYLFRSLCGQSAAEVTRIRDRIDLGSYHHLVADHLALNDIGEVELKLSRPVPFDPYDRNREMGSFILVDRMTNATVACGMIVHAMRRADNVVWHREDVGREERAAVKGHRPRVVWLTGLSGSGKSTIANALERRLNDRGCHTMLLDGDNIRHGINRDLGFTEADRIENIRRIGEIAKLMADAGLIVITAFISPFRAERDLVRSLLPNGEFVEVHVSTPLPVCEQRDPKGLYGKARRGEIPNFTGINSPYEEPEHPELRLDTSVCDVDECVEMVLGCLDAL